MYSGDYNVPMVASLGTALPVAFALQNAVDPLRIKSVDLTIEALSEKKQFNIAQAWTNRREVKPGDTIDLNVLLEGQGNKEIVRQLRYEVPAGAPTGTLNITVADGPTTNAGEGKTYMSSQGRPAAEIIALLNGLRGSTRGYARFWRADPAWSVEEHDLPDPPPSVSLILARTPGVATNPGRGTTAAELSFDAGDAVITGSKTIQVEVKE
jgi:hypothetical protein